MPISASRVGARWVVRAALAVTGLANMLPGSAQAPQAGPVVEFGAEEIARIVAHGPWPAPDRTVGPRDPTNRASGNPDAIELGRRLFFDRRLSESGTISCATCHDPARAFTDGRPRAQGIGLHDRNTQGLLDVARQRWFGWDGGADSLWAASIRPLLAAHEMGGSAQSVVKVIAGDAGLGVLHRKVFGESKDAQTTLADAGKALAAFQETLVSPRTAFDDFRDALAAARPASETTYPQAAQRGLKIFIGKGNCTLCHVGPNFSNGEFHDIGRPFMIEPGRVDPGRFTGLRRVSSDPFNLLSVFNDQPATVPVREQASLKTRTVALLHRNWGEWRTPSLRELTRTAPYMHDGSLASLRDVILHYSELDEDRLHADGENLLKPLRLTGPEIDELVVFLESLSW